MKHEEKIIGAAFEMSYGVRRTGEWLDAQMMEGKSNDRN